MRIFTSFYAFAYAHSVVYISLRHLMAVSMSKRFAASCCHCCKRRPGIMTKLLLAVPYGPRAERDTNWSEFKCSVPCARMCKLLTMRYPWTCQFASVRSHQCQRHSCLSLSTSRGCEVLLLSFVTHEETRWNKDIKPTGLHMQVWYWSLRWISRV